MKEWRNLTWPEAKEAVEEMPVCLLPLGAIEAHGPHMKLDVDNHICEEQCRRVCAETGIILMPTIPVGQVWSLNRFPGTLTLSYHTLIAVIKDCCTASENEALSLFLFTATIMEMYLQ